MILCFREFSFPVFTQLCDVGRYFTGLTPVAVYGISDFS